MTTTEIITDNNNKSKKVFSKEYRLKIIEKAKGRVGPFKGTRFTELHREPISNSLKGRKLSPTHKQNLSISIRAWWSNPINRARMKEIEKGTSTLRQHNNISK